MNEGEATPWYRDGLCFSCTRCGRCCSGPETGFVWVSRSEIDELARFLDLDVDTFGRRYLRRVRGFTSLIEHPNNDCIFFDRDQGCTVYSARPQQCRSFPFWDENLDTESAWQKTGRDCPGIGGDHHHSFDEVERIRRALHS